MSLAPFFTRQQRHGGGRQALSPRSREMEDINRRYGDLIQTYELRGARAIQSVAVLQQRMVDATSWKRRCSLACMAAFSALVVTS